MHGYYRIFDLGSCTRADTWVMTENGRMKMGGSEGSAALLGTL